MASTVGASSGVWRLAVAPGCQGISALCRCSAKIAIIKEAVTERTAIVLKILDWLGCDILNSLFSTSHTVEFT